jgi:putative hydroxymethylpyrimidine transport system permease protein
LSRLGRPFATAAGLILAWWAATWLTAVPPYLLPGPWAVATALWTQRALLFRGALTTAGEVGAGLLIGVLLGGLFGLLVVFSPVLRRWLMPLLLISQAVPVFALAPLLVLWFGFGMASKIVMAVLVIFFPVTAAFADGLRRTDQGLVDLALTMNASPVAILRHVRLPAALPSFGSGLRIAAVVAPIGAIIGEWVGASAGLGYVMLNANARMETAVMFAALLVLSVMTILLWVAVDLLLRKLLFWAPDMWK